MYSSALLLTALATVVLHLPSWVTLFFFIAFLNYGTKALDNYIRKISEEIVPLLPMKAILLAIELKCRLLVVWNVLLGRFGPVVINDVQVIPYISNGKIYHAVLRRNLSKEYRSFLDSHSVAVTSTDGTQRENIRVESHIELPHLVDSKSVEYFVDGNPIAGVVKDFRPIIEKLASQNQDGYDD